MDVPSLTKLYRATLSVDVLIEVEDKEHLAQELRDAVGAISHWLDEEFDGAEGAKVVAVRREAQ